MKDTLEKYKHNTTGKFHVIKLMVDNIEKGGVDPKEGFGSIHETIIKMTNTSRDKFQEYSMDILVVIRNKTDLIPKIGGCRASSLRPIVVGGITVFKTTVDNHHIFFMYLDDYRSNPLYLIGKLVSQLAIKKIVIEDNIPNLDMTLDEDKIEVIRSFESLGLMDSIQG